MEFILGIATAFWVGILTSISPCPLTTNIAAISFITKRIENTKVVLFTGFLYAMGRVVAYIVISILILESISTIPGLSFFLQNQIHRILGPMLIIVGMFFLELISINLPSFSISSKLQHIFKSLGIWGAFPLGILFALSFCPVSAALYFGSLIPLAAKLSSSFILPSMYGIGSGFPVFIFAFLIAFSANRLGKILNRMQKFDYWFRWVTGIVFIIAGIYLSLVYIFGM